MTDKTKEVRYYGKKLYILNPAIVRKKPSNKGTPDYRSENIEERHDIVSPKASSK